MVAKHSYINLIEKPEYSVYRYWDNPVIEEDHISYSIHGDGMNSRQVVSQIQDGDQTLKLHSIQQLLQV